MPRLTWILAAGIVLAVLVATAPLSASPRDTKVGDVRAVFARTGTPLREKASALGKAVASLAYGTQVKVLEANLPWIRVQTVPPRGQAPQTGWLRAFETVEAAALAGNAKPAHATYTGKAGAGVSQREVSAAGRQLDAGTEKGYRKSRADLDRAYRLVDAMEAATQALDPGDSIAFIVEGGLGRVGRGYERPGRVAAKPAGGGRAAKRKKALGGIASRLGGEALRRAGAGDKAARLGEGLIEGVRGYVGELKKAFTPQQEYFIGRAVAAEAIAEYGVDKSEKRRRYVRLVGDAVVRLSSRLPANFGGYHFEVLDSDEVNGVSGPGGFVLLTRGAVEATKCEAELAGVIAHELAHIRNKHGEKILRKGSKFGAMMKGLSGFAGKMVPGQAGQWAGELVKFFGQVVGEMKKTAIGHAYGKQFEFDADKEGTYQLYDVYYDQAALRDFLGHMREDEDHHGEAATHASPAARAKALEPVLAPLQPFNPGESTRKARAERYGREMGRAPPVPSFGSGK